MILAWFINLVSKESSKLPQLGAYEVTEWLKNVGKLWVMRMAILENLQCTQESPHTMSLGYF